MMALTGGTDDHRRRGRRVRGQAEARLRRPLTARREPARPVAHPEPAVDRPLRRGVDLPRARPRPPGGGGRSGPDERLGPAASATAVGRSLLTRAVVRRRSGSRVGSRSRRSTSAVSAARAAEPVGASDPCRRAVEARARAFAMVASILARLRTMPRPRAAALTSASSNAATVSRSKPANARRNASRLRRIVSHEAPTGTPRARAAQQSPVLADRASPLLVVVAAYSGADTAHAQRTAVVRGRHRRLRRSSRGRGSPGRRPTGARLGEPVQQRVHLRHPVAADRGAEPDLAQVVRPSTDRLRAPERPAGRRTPRPCRRRDRAATRPRCTPMTAKTTHGDRRNGPHPCPADGPHGGRGRSCDSVAP